MVVLLSSWTAERQCYVWGLSHINFARCNSRVILVLVIRSVQNAIILFSRHQLFKNNGNLVGKYEK